MKETVVSFEIAKKLQEKGYDWQTFDWYSPFGDFSVGMLPRTLQGCPMRRECYAPTIGLALKWLREVKKIYVDISLRYDGWDSDFHSIHSNEVQNRFFCVGTHWGQCIPYNDDTKHLIGTTKSAPEFYVTWKE